MRIIGIETSCDETGTSIIEADTKDKKVTILSHSLSSSLALHAKTGGIIPETAAREQLRYITHVIDHSLKEANMALPDIDVIAVTVGPGLIGSLLVGVETAKTLAYVWNKPIIPVNHLMGHIYANWIKPSTDYGLPTTAVDRRLSTVDEIDFPALALIVSGGHTDLVLIKNHGKLQWLGGTRDDAAGEAFDKIGRLLNMPYPGGPVIEKAAKRGIQKRFAFPRPLIDSPDFDFSFSGLKTAVLREVQKIKKIDEQTVNDISLEVQNAIIDVLIKKTLKAAEKYNVKSILLGGGVAANQTLSDSLQSSILNLKSSIRLFVPPKSLCTDNGAMIAAAAFFNHKEVPWQKVTANPELYFD